MLPDIPIADPNLVGWWKFETGAGATVIDFSGHGNHGTIVDKVFWVPGQFNLALEFFGDNTGHVELPLQAEFPSIGEDTLQGNRCVRLCEHENSVHRVWAPLSGRVVATNEDGFLGADAARWDTLCKSWLIRILPKPPRPCRRGDRMGTRHR